MYAVHFLLLLSLDTFLTQNFLLFFFSFTLEVHPSVPTNVEVQRTSPTSIRVTWEAPNTSVSGYYIYYRSNYNDRLYWEVVRIPPGTHYDIENLYPNQAYHVRVKAANDYGISAMSQEVIAYP